MNLNRPLKDVDDKTLVEAAKDIFDLHKTGVWPNGQPPEWLKTFTSYIPKAGMTTRMEIAPRLVRDEIMLRWIAASRQVHPHVVEAIEELRKGTSMDCLGLEYLSCKHKETCGLVNECLIVKGLLDTEKSAAFWRERTFKPCEEAHMTNPPKPTCPTLRKIVSIWKDIKAELSKSCGHDCIHSEAMGELTKEFEALFPKGVFDE